MPELPEVETLRRSLEPALPGRLVAGVRLVRRDVLVAPGDPVGGFSRQRTRPHPVRFADDLLLVGDRINGLRRRGKQLAIVGARGHAVIVQLGMTGRLEHAVDPEPDAHAHVAWSLDDGSVLRFIDARRFGLIRLAPEGPADAWADLGPDALDIRSDRLAARLRGARRAVKAALLDQRVLAGVGNIYADEALFGARLHPTRAGESLSREETGALAHHIRRVLRGAIRAGGSTIRDYRDGSGRVGSFQRRHAVYGRAGLPCRRCGSMLERGRVAQRTTVWCPVCQPVATGAIASRDGSHGRGF